MGFAGFAVVAQLVERVLGKDEVTSSILVNGSRTSSFRPWELIALEELASRGDAMARESFLKSRAGIAERRRLFG